MAWALDRKSVNYSYTHFEKIVATCSLPLINEEEPWERTLWCLHNDRLPRSEDTPSVSRLLCLVGLFPKEAAVILTLISLKIAQR